MKVVDRLLYCSNNNIAEVNDQVQADSSNHGPPNLVSRFLVYNKVSTADQEVIHDHHKAFIKVLEEVVA